jgi:hypothetical protein
MTSARASYAGYRVPAEIIGHAVWLFFRFSLGLGIIEELRPPAASLLATKRCGSGRTAGIGAKEPFDGAVDEGRPGDATQWGTAAI